jgi:hypothetical protein
LDEAEEKVIKLNGVVVRKEGDRVVFECPLGLRDSEGKTPCDRLAEILEKAREIVTRVIVEKKEEKRK